MKAKLTSNDMWSPVLEFTIEQFPLVIGRNGKSDIQVDDRWVSAQQCELIACDGELEVRDLRSRHGTLVNGKRIRRVVLKSGDTLTVEIRSFPISYRRSRRRSPSSNAKSKRGAQQESALVGTAVSCGVTRKGAHPTG